MRSITGAAMAVLAACLLAAAAHAHFQVIKPSRDIVTTEGPREITLDLRFTHPMEQGPVMEMGEPRAFGVLTGGAKRDLRETLTERKIDGHTAYTASYTARRPGDLVFFVEPAPYWEPAEQKMIVHYTKVVVSAFGMEEGWDAEVGFPVEIEPLVRPYGLWTGNVFRGVVKKNGEPVPHAEVEVEYLNEGMQVEPPASPFVTQVIKTDENGVFSYAMPRQGWWGFAALIEGEDKLPNPDGEMVDVELGALMWVRCRDMK